MKLKHEYVVREILGDTLMVPIGSTIREQNGLFTLNETGAFLLQHLSDAQSPRELTTALLAEYEVDERTAEEAVAEFLNKLIELDVIDPV